ncbi:phage tail protein [Paenibacillus humicola]|uniref:phage tail protein n=1 Tax=Paenibacillus humicola TaxID=3110540 RepID=UPI00237C30EA|nr:tail fiber protein [Paenibacillus humicola]
MDPYVGEIRLFAGNFPPKDWAFCDGSLLPIAQNTALFSILGVTYGGDGKTTFALPNLNGSAAMHQGAGPGLTPRTLGESVGEPNVTLLQTEMPAHTHVPQNQTTSSATSPEGAVWANVAGRAAPLYGTAPKTAMNVQAVGPAGGSMPHNNMQPYLGMNFIISLYGVYPPHS